MNAEEKRKIQTLETVNFGKADGTRRLVESLAALAHDKPWVPLSVRQWHALQSIYHKWADGPDCLVCKAMKDNEPLVYLVCPSCSYKLGIIQRHKHDAQHYCPRCSRHPLSQFKMEWVKLPTSL